MVMSEPRRKQPCELGGQRKGEIPNTQGRLVSNPTLRLSDTDNPFHLWVGDMGWQKEYDSTLGALETAYWSECLDPVTAG